MLRNLSAVLSRDACSLDVLGWLFSKAVLPLKLDTNRRVALHSVKEETY